MVKMPVPNGEEQILFPSENGSEVSKSPSLDFNPDSVDWSPPVSTVYTDVGVVPEHEKNELDHLISHLESMSKLSHTLLSLFILFQAYGFKSEI